PVVRPLSLLLSICPEEGAIPIHQTGLVQEIADLGCDAFGRTNGDPECRQGVHEGVAIAPADNATVEDNACAAVVGTADQPAKTLLEAQDGLRNRILRERILELLTAGSKNRIGRHRERQLRYDEKAKGIADDVNPFPERVRAEDDRPWIRL